MWEEFKKCKDKSKEKKVSNRKWIVEVRKDDDKEGFKQ